MKRLLVLLIFVLLVFISTPVFPFTFYVNPGDRIQEAIDIAIDGDVIIVRDGTYTEDGNRDIDFHGKAITLISENGPEVTIIDCEGTETDPHRGFYFDSDEGPDSVVEGFTIRNGFASGNWPDNSGGGVHCDGSSPTIRHCIITGNSARSCGGGIFCDSSGPMIEQCTISGNEADDGGGIFCQSFSNPTITNCSINNNKADYGGGIYCISYSSPTIADCMIDANTAAEWGGGIYCWWFSSPEITGCEFSGNSAHVFGGGICCTYGSSPVITNCMIYGNIAGGGGAVFCDTSAPAIANCTIIGNTAEAGGGVWCYDHSDLMIINCILWGNAASVGHEVALVNFDDSHATLTARYSDVQGGAGEAYVESGCTLDLDGTNIDLDPLFVKGPLHDFYLSHLETGQAAESPCIDAGSDTAENLGLDELSTRTDGMPDEGIVDMGYHAPYALWIDSITKNGNDISIHWNAREGISYVVEWCYDLEIWHGFGVGEVSEVTDYGGGLLPQVYYRVREE